jgi:TonB family protein
MIKERSLQFYTMNSLIVHVFCVCAAMLISYIYVQDKMNLRKFNTKLLEASVRVDMVALPDKTLKELKSLQQLNAMAPAITKKAVKVVKEEPIKEVVKKVIETKDETTKFLKNKKKKSLSDMLKKYSDKKVKVSKKSTKKKVKSNKMDSKTISRLEGLVKKGNVVKSGAAIAGTGSQQELDEFEKYLVKLPEIVRPFWKLPSYLLDQGLRCRIQLFISKDGKVIRKIISESSGEKEFDQRAMRAVESVGLFPAVSDLIKKKVASGSIVLAFPI